MWAETPYNTVARLREKISIHSARVGGDLQPPSQQASNRHFNPLRPCGRRRLFLPPLSLANSISIHSARVGGDLKQVPQERQTDLISIHSARVGGDLGEQVRKLRVEISIHSARVGGDHHFQIIYPF